MGSTSVIPGGADPMGLFKNFSLFRSMTQDEEEPLELFASRVTQQSLLIETFCDEDRVLQAKNQVLWGMRSSVIQEEAIHNRWTLEELMTDKKHDVSEVSDIKIEAPEENYNESDLGDLEEMDQSEDEDSNNDVDEDFLDPVKEEEHEGGSPSDSNIAERTPPEFKDEGGKFICTGCDTRYLTEAALVEHRKKDYKCIECTSVIPCLKKFRRHTIEVHHKYYCNSCDTYYKSAYFLKKHRTEVHIRKGRSLQCDFCGIEFPNKVAFKNHMENSCPECKLCPPTREDAAKHMKEVHQRTLKNQCHICDKVLCGTYALKIHLKTMHDPSSHIHQCDICPRKFALERLLKSHVLRVHLKKRMFRCEKCFKGFNSPKELQRHIDGVHEKKIASICHICSKVFYHDSGLKWHIERVHEGVKHHKCESCEMEFYNRSELVKHIKAIHEKTRDFKCEYCGRLFNRKSVMVQHIKSLHTFEKNYRCSICGKTYVSKYHMTRHIKEGHEHYTRDCDICHKPFAGYGTGNLKKHKRTVHGIQ